MGWFPEAWRASALHRYGHHHRATYKRSSSAGFFLFVPEDYDKDVIAQSGLRLLVCRDVTSNMAEVAAKRRAAREARSAAVREVEGDATYEAEQKFRAVTSRLAAEGRLSFVYVSEKSS